MLQSLSVRKLVSFLPLLVIALVLVLAGCGSSTQSKSGTSSSGNDMTSQQGSANDHQSSDSQSSDDQGGSGSLTQLATSQLLDKGKTYNYTFKDEGNYTIICSIHPSMVMNIQVKADAGSSKKTVDIQNFAFKPAKMTIAPGTTVTWTNDDTTQHTVVVQK